MKRKNAVRLISLLLILGVMMAIVLFSSQSGITSNQFSKGILQMILEALHLNFEGTQAEMANLVLRKIAHFSLYCLLGVGCSAFLLTTKLSLKQRMVLSIAFCLLFAASDELHQFLLGTRNGNGKDVLLDTLGASVGSVLVVWVGWILRSKNEKK